MGKTNKDEKQEVFGDKEDQDMSGQTQESEKKDQTISVAVSQKTKQMLDLLLVMTDMSMEDAFEYMVHRFAKKTVCKMLGGKKGHAHHGHRGHGHRCGHAHHGHPYGHGDCGCGHGADVDGLGDTAGEDDGFGMCGHHRRHGWGKRGGFGKAFGRIPLWSRRRRQFSHQILKSFFCTEKDGVALRDEMYAFFSKRNEGITRAQFDSNLNNMGTEGGNSHGHVFDFESGEVRLAEHIAERAQQFREKFVNDEQ